MTGEPDNVEQVANALERFCLVAVDKLADPDFDAISLAASMLRIASSTVPSFMQEVKMRAVALRRQAEVYPASKRAAGGRSDD